MKFKKTRMLLLFTLGTIVSNGCGKTTLEDNKIYNEKDVIKDKGNHVEDIELNRYIESMTAEEKIGQIIMTTFDSSEANKLIMSEDINIGEAKEYMDLKVGNFILSNGRYANFVNTRDNYPEPAFSENDSGKYLIAKKNSLPLYLGFYNNELQKEAAKRGIPPLFIAVDEEGGGSCFTRVMDGLPDYPSNMMLAATWYAGADEETRAKKALIFSFEKGEMIGRHLSAMGFNILLGPVADTNSENNILEDRGFGSDPNVSGYLTRAFVAGVHEGGSGKVLSIVKHFPGHGDAKYNPEIVAVKDTHDEEYRNDFMYKPFMYALDGENSKYFKENVLGRTGEADGLMPSHVGFEIEEISSGDKPFCLDRGVFKYYFENEPAGYPLAGFSKWYSRRGKLIITDDIYVWAINKGYEYSKDYGAGWRKQVALEAILAGCDMLILGKGKKEEKIEVIQYLQNLYKEEGNESFKARVDDAVKRVISAKYKAFRGSVVSTEAEGTPLGVRTEGEIRRDVDELIIKSKKADDSKVKTISETAITISSPGSVSGWKNSIPKHIRNSFRKKNIVLIYPEDKDLYFDEENPPGSLKRVLNEKRGFYGAPPIRKEDCIWYSNDYPGEKREREIKPFPVIKNQLKERLDFYLDRGTPPLIIVVDKYYVVEKPIKPDPSLKGSYKKEMNDKSAVEVIENVINYTTTEKKYKGLETVIISLKYESWSSIKGNDIFDFVSCIVETYGRTSAAFTAAVQSLSDNDFECYGVCPVDSDYLGWDFERFNSSLLNTPDIYFKEEVPEEKLGDSTISLSFGSIKNNGKKARCLEGYPVFFEIYGMEDKRRIVNFSRLEYVNDKGLAVFKFPHSVRDINRIDDIEFSISVNNDSVFSGGINVIRTGKSSYSRNRFFIHLARVFSYWLGLHLASLVLVFVCLISMGIKRATSGDKPVKGRYLDLFRVGLLFPCLFLGGLFSGFLFEVILNDSILIKDIPFLEFILEEIMASKNLPNLVFLSSSYCLICIFIFINVATLVLQIIFKLARWVLSSGEED